MDDPGSGVGRSTAYARGIAAEFGSDAELVACGLSIRTGVSLECSATRPTISVSLLLSEVTGVMADSESAVAVASLAAVEVAVFDIKDGAKALDGMADAFSG